jgi:hypothetical protein
MLPVSFPYHPGIIPISVVWAKSFPVSDLGAVRVRTDSLVPIVAPSPEPVNYQKCKSLAEVSGN